jgi:hypothetical protein
MSCKETCDELDSTSCIRITRECTRVFAKTNCNSRGRYKNREFLMENFMANECLFIIR